VPSAAASLTHRRSGIDLEKHQTKCSNKKNLEEEQKAAQEFVVGEDHQGQGLTAADRLLFNVQADPSVSHVALFGRYESGALTLHYRKKNSKTAGKNESQNIQFLKKSLVMALLSNLATLFANVAGNDRLGR